MRKNLSFAVLPLLLAVGCGGAGTGPSGDAASANAALDSVDGTATESALLMISTDPATASMTTGAEVAIAAKLGAPLWFSPLGCLAVSVTQNAITYKFNNCTGPWGLVHVSGTLSVSYTLDANGLSAHAVADQLTIDGATLDLDATGVLALNGPTKKLTVSTTSKGTGPRGNSISRHGDYTASWDAASLCGSIDGAWSTTINGNTWATTISGYERCKLDCPKAGGSITYTDGHSHVTVSVSFDGSADVKWSTSNGSHGTASLFCI